MAKRKSVTEVPPPAPAPQEGYTVLARRYRPQQFTEIVGQEAVSRSLVNALQSNRVAHAYLFTGARGVGKTSTARILAKALNCVNGPTITPCGVCDACRSIATGEDVDVLEIDGASNRRIEEIREIRQNVQYRPSRSRYKIYIIDEVHQLTKDAFNALLKTLEEPPPHVKFIFATTEANKVPVTILSRCQRFDFVGIGASRIVDRLREVVLAEGMQADDDALDLIARRAGGSMRDAQSLLDQLLAFGGERLTSEQVHGLLGTAHDDRVAELAGAVLSKDVPGALKILADAAGTGLQLGELVDQLIEYWRDLMVVQCAGPQAPDLSVPPRHREVLVQQTRAMKLDTILAGLDILATTKARLRGSNHGRVLLEMAVVRLGRLDDLMSLAQLADLLAGGAAPVASKPVSRAESAPAPPRPASLITRPPEAAPPPRPALAVAAATTGLTEETLPRIWAEMLNQVGPMMRSRWEKAGIPAISAPNSLVLSFAATYNDIREHCQDPRHVERVEGLLKTLTGQTWSIRIDSSGAEARAEVPAASEVAEGSQTRNRRQEFEALKEREPLIKRAIEVLGAMPVHHDPGFGATGAPSAEATGDDTPEEA